MKEDEPEIRLRPASRILIVDSNDRILLFFVRLAYTSAWITPGGGLEPGESHEEAAVRELEEETGLRGATLSPCVGTVEFEFAHADLLYHQRERYFVARVDSHEVRSEGWTASESKEIERVRWWTLEEIIESSDNFRPADLPLVLPAVLAGEYPPLPLLLAPERGVRPLPQPGR